MHGGCAFYVELSTSQKGIPFYVYQGLFLDVQDWDHQNPTQIVTEMCGFLTILSGTFLLHKTKDMADSKLFHAIFMQPLGMFCFVY
jgi:hypothetical protein